MGEKRRRIAPDRSGFPVCGRGTDSPAYNCRVTSSHCTGTVLSVQTCLFRKGAYHIWGLLKRNGPVRSYTFPKMGCTLFRTSEALLLSKRQAIRREWSELSSARCAIVPPPTRRHQFYVANPILYARSRSHAMDSDAWRQIPPPNCPLHRACPLYLPTVLAHCTDVALHRLHRPRLPACATPLALS